MLIVVPSLISGAGLLFIIVGIWLEPWWARNIAFTVGVVLLWLDFFATMAIFRYTSRNTDRRLKHLEEALEPGPASRAGPAS